MISNLHYFHNAFFHISANRCYQWFDFQILADQS